MSIRHYVSDVDDLDDRTYRMLDSRFCKVAMHGQRHESLRTRRHDELQEMAAPRKPRRHRDRAAADQAVD